MCRRESCNQQSMVSTATKTIYIIIQHASYYACTIEFIIYCFVTNCGLVAFYDNIFFTRGSMKLFAKCLTYAVLFTNISMYTTIRDVPIIGLAISNGLYWLVFSYQSSDRFMYEISKI